jgi:toxin ParE1/3/4
MAYKIIVSPRAQKEIENAIDYYALYSVNAPFNFVLSLKGAYDTLKEDPFRRIRYKSIRSLKLKKFPYSIYFVINETENLVRVLSCFHDKRNPERRPEL